MQPDLGTIAIKSRGIQLYFSAPRSVAKLAISIQTLSEANGVVFLAS